MIHYINEFTAVEVVFVISFMKLDMERGCAKRLPST